MRKIKDSRAHIFCGIKMQLVVKSANIFGKGEMRCPACGSTNMLLIRIWTKTKGVIYEWGRELSAAVPVTMPMMSRAAVSLPPIYRQLVLPI